MVRQDRIQARVLGLGIMLETGTSLARFGGGSVTLESVHTGKTHEIEAAGVVMVTSRLPQDALYHSLADRVTIQRIGDCLAPGTIATSVYSGHQCAQEMDAGTPADVRFLRERAPVR